MMQGCVWSISLELHHVYSGIYYTWNVVQTYIYLPLVHYVHINLYLKIQHLGLTQGEHQLRNQLIVTAVAL